MDDRSALYLFYICLHLFLALAVNKVRQDKVTRIWARFFSIGLVILAAQYTLMGLDSAAGNRLYGRFQTLLSALNNPFFLAGALTLLDRTNRSDRSRRLFSDPIFLTVLGATFCIVVGILLSGKDVPRALYLGAAAVSVAVYAVEAFAYFAVLNFFRYNFLRFLPLITASLFSIQEVLIASSAQWKLPDYVSILLRFLFFIPPMLILTLRMPQDLELKKVFEKARQRREFILSEKLVESIGDLVKAQKVMLLMKKPDFHLGKPKSLEDQFDGYPWEKGRTEDGGFYSLKTALEETTREEREFLQEVCPRDWDEGRCPRLYCRSEGGFETIVLPIEVYGGVIGALYVRLQARVRTRAIFVEKLRLSTLTLLPLVQGSRQMAAIGMLNERFMRNLMLDGRAAGREGAGGKLELTEGVDEILRSILNTLSPVAVALKPSPHFNSAEPVFQPDDKYFPNEHRGAFIEKYFGAWPDDDPLGDIKPFHRKTDFGRLIMFVGKEGDHPDRPTMGIHPVVLNVLEAMTNSALKTILRRNIRRILEEADKELSEGATKVVDEEHVVLLLQKYAKYFGVSWVVVVLDGARFHGHEEKFAFVRQQMHACKADGKIEVKKFGEGDGAASWLVYSGWPLESPARNNSRPESDISFWFGVENPEFRRDDTWDSIFLQLIQLGIAKIKDLRMRDLLEQWNIEQENQLRELARFCWFVGNEAKLITFRVKEESAAPDRSAHFHRLKLLADELNEAGDFLSRLVQEGAPPSERLVLQEVIQEAWDGLNPSGQNPGALLFQGDCRAKVVAAKDELLFLFSRLLHWLTSASEEEGGAPVRVNVRCRLDGLRVEVSLESGGPRMHRALRESMLVPMTQPIDYDQLSKVRGPKLFLAMYLVNTILNKRYKGSLADQSDKLPGETGHKLVVTMPILN